MSVCFFPLTFLKQLSGVRLVLVLIYIAISIFTIAYCTFLNLKLRKLTRGTALEAKYCRMSPWKLFLWQTLFILILPIIGAVATILIYRYFWSKTMREIAETGGKIKNKKKLNID